MKKIQFIVLFVQVEHIKQLESYPLLNVLIAKRIQQEKPSIVNGAIIG
ncbi:hypothetical protein GH754_10370 [Salinibacillus xinjiangensis]|uniref:Uncharacterized protein n=1 Tax=Salinibacillus xinjiangensis TaxID=1229268 RepID=A0A6G1X730_9BACI|nr:hypothetical protein [Salinibacillus xinjiangensis]